MRKVWISGVISLLVLLAPVFADTIKLKNGDRLTGSIVKSDEETIVIKTSTDFAKRIRQILGLCMLSAGSKQQLKHKQFLKFYAKLCLFQVFKRGGKMDILHCLLSRH